MGTSTVETVSEQEILRLRGFNRFYTQRIGILDRIGSDLPLPAARLIFEIASLAQPSSAELARTVGLDPGYVSRLLKTLSEQGLIEKKHCPEDGRRRRLQLSEAGARLHAELTEQTNTNIGSMLGALAPDDRRRALDAAWTLENLLGGGGDTDIDVREHGCGDLGWVLLRHGEFYRQAFGFDDRFEAIVAQIIGEFSCHQNTQRERLWIAEDAFGQRLGSIMLVQEGEREGRGDTARLRLFFVEPHARGRGVGSKLMSKLFDFARRRGYKSIVLSTVDALDAARRLYERAGFVLESEHSHQDWSVPVTEQEWRMEL